MKKTNKKTTDKKSIAGVNYYNIWEGLKSLWECGEFTVTKDTYYNIQERNGEAQAYKNKIVNWVGKEWMYLEKNGETFTNEKELQNINRIFKDGSRKTFKDKYFTNNFCSGDIYMFPKTNALNEIKCQIMDSRTLIKNADDFWVIQSYTQRVGAKVKEIPHDGLYSSIASYNPNNPLYWKSIFKSIVYDALSDKESSQRQYYYFKNGMTSQLIMLDPEITDKETLETIRWDLKDKYSWSENAHKSIISSAIKDAKTLELSNKDLELIGLRKFIIQKMGIIFQIDPRIIWFMSDSGADRSIWSIRAEASETIENLSQVFEDDINNFYREFINPKADFIIRLNNESFEDRAVIEAKQREDVQLWIITINEVRNERKLDEFKEDEANKPMVSSSMSFLESLWDQFTI